MKRRGKTIALSTVAVGLVVLVAAGFTAWSRLEEEWWLYKLDFGDKGERCQAAERLGSLHSARAAPFLVAAMRRAIADHSFVAQVEFQMGDTEWCLVKEELIGREGLLYFETLRRIGKPVLPGLIRFLSEEKSVKLPDVRLLVALAIVKTHGGWPERSVSIPHFPGKDSSVPVDLLCQLAEDTTLSPEGHAAAKEALKKMQGKKHDAQR